MSDAERRLIRDLIGALAGAFRPSSGTSSPKKPQATKKRAPKKTKPKKTAPKKTKVGTYPGDYTGSFGVSYTPSINRKPDPGEIVWTWVPYEEDFSQGKDRPVLLVGRDGKWLLGLMLTSKDHDRDAADEARWGRYWMDLGTGPWDKKRRPSEIRLDRVLRVNPDSVRREGAILDETRFDAVIRAVRDANGW